MVLPTNLLKSFLSITNYHLAIWPSHYLTYYHHQNHLWHLGHAIWHNYLYHFHHKDCAVPLKRITNYLGRARVKFWDCVRQKRVLQHISEKWFLSILDKFVTKYWSFVSNRNEEESSVKSFLKQTFRLDLVALQPSRLFLHRIFFPFRHIDCWAIILWDYFSSSCEMVFLGEPFSTLFVIWHFPTILSKEERGSPNISFRISLKKQFVCIGNYEIYSDLCFIGCWNKLAKLNVNAWFKTLHGPLTTV